jgi:predicted metal-dependent phosphoesterase TrpH
VTCDSLDAVGLKATDKDALSLNADLHCHSLYSDGTLDPVTLAKRAFDSGVQLWALTDHDETAGIALAREAAQKLGLPFVTGVEISVTFEGETIHVLGLGIDETQTDLQVGLARNRAGRDQRAQAMGEALAQAGIPGAYEGALCLAAGNVALISRTHFARYIVHQGICRHTQQVFTRYLRPGKPGFVPHAWARLEEAITWIRQARGVAVLAHPGRYALTAGREKTLLDAFQQAGGQAIEVISSSHGPAQAQRYARLATRRGLWASSGSDFHGPSESRFDLGRAGLMKDLGESVVAIWQAAAWCSH